MTTATITTASDIESATLADYVALLKPRVMSLVVFVGAAGIIVAPASLHPVLALVAVLCIALSAGAAASINMWFDADIDAVMTRTKNRPVPVGRISAQTALEFGVVLGVLASLLMLLAVGWQAALWLTIANLFYVLVYTMWLKRRTSQNIVIGGAAGAFPPVIGWAAAMGDVAHPAPWLMFALIFLWTPPHFWALALYKADEYAKADVPMMPSVRGAAHTKNLMLAYTLLLVPVALAPYFIGFGGVAYLLVASVLAILFVWCAVRVQRAADNKPAQQMFAFSILYLFLLFGTLMAEHLLGVI